MEKIDFVLPWVDGSDPQWLAEKRNYEKSGESMSGGEANAECRYRDLGMLRYWFRSVERFAPWVNHVFFVTCGQKPIWLDERNPKLRLVKHADYIPPECLPTFQSNSIELNLHRIPDLSERFVLFNDDLFLLRPVSPELFFRNGLPVIPCDLGIPRWIGCSNTSRIALNNSAILRTGLNVERLVWRNMWKFVNMRALGIVRAVKNIVAFSVNRVYIAGTFGHIAQPHLKSTFDEIWRVCPSALNRTARSRFRTDDCVSHWLASAWDMVSGRFFPANEKRMGEFVALNEETLERVCDIILRRPCFEICLNDKGSNDELERCFAKVALAFESILPEKSSFER